MEGQVATASAAGVQLWPCHLLTLPYAVAYLMTQLQVGRSLFFLFFGQASTFSTVPTILSPIRPGLPPQVQSSVLIKFPWAYEEPPMHPSSHP